MADEVIELDNEDEEYTYLQSLHPHPKDGMVRFQAKDHTYTLIRNPDGSDIQEGASISLLSVTTFFKSYTPPFPGYIVSATCKSINTRFQFWYENRDKYPDPSATHPRFKGPIWPDKYHCFIHPDVFKHILAGSEEALSELKHPLPTPLGTFLNKDVSAAWSRDGTQLHADIERFLNRVPSPMPACKEWQYFMQFLEERPDLKIIRTEMRLVHLELGICGTLDGLAMRSTDGRYVLIDWKMSKKLKQKAGDDEVYKVEYMKPPLQHLESTSRNLYYLQQNLYKILLKKEYGYDLAEMILVVLHQSNDGPVIIQVPDLGQDPKTRAALTQILNDRVKAAKREREGVVEGESRKRAREEEVEESRKRARE